MEVIIRNNGGESTEIIKIDFFQLLDENFNQVFNAIANNVRILKGLKCYIDEGRLQVNDLVRIIRSSKCPGEAVRKLSEEKGMSMKAAKYLMNMSLSKMVSLSSEGLEEELSKYRKKMDEISSLCQPEIEFFECKNTIKKEEVL